MENNNNPLDILQDDNLVKEFVQELIDDVGASNLLIAAMIFFGAGGLASGLYLKLFKNN
jgi:hypothetical protein